MEFLYYPGCSVEYTAKMYDSSARAVIKALGHELKDVEDWNCCGATTYMAIHELVSHGNSIRNLALARKTGATDLVTVCPACYLTLLKTNHYYIKEPEFSAMLRQGLKAAGLDYDGGLRVRHLLDVLVRDIGLKAVSDAVKKPLKGLKVACYHGCMLTRPYGEIDSKEKPDVMDRLISAIGAEPVNYQLSAKCCGGMVTNTETAKLIPNVAGLIKCAYDAGADCIAVACPLCHMNLDFYQPEAHKLLGLNKRIPIVYFTQLMGLAYELPKKELGFGLELTSTESVVAKFA
jgi:heterodisulfide reductase subunit B